MQKNFTQRWAAHRVGATGREVMFITRQFRNSWWIARRKKDHRNLCRRAAHRIEVLRPGKDVKQLGDEEVITYSLDRFGTPGRRAADLDGMVS